MKKENNPYQAIPGSAYVLLPDDRVARLLTPSSTPSGDKRYSLRVDGVLRKYSLDTLKSWIAGKPPFTDGDKA